MAGWSCDGVDRQCPSPPGYEGDAGIRIEGDGLRRDEDPAAVRLQGGLDRCPPGRVGRGFGMEERRELGQLADVRLDIDADGAGVRDPGGGDDHDAHGVGHADDGVPAPVARRTVVDSSAGEAPLLQPQADSADGRDGAPEEVTSGDSRVGMPAAPREGCSDGGPADDGRTDAHEPVCHAPTLPRSRPRAAG